MVHARTQSGPAQRRWPALAACSSRPCDKQLARTRPMIFPSMLLILCVARCAGIGPGGCRR